MSNSAAPLANTGKEAIYGPGGLPADLLSVVQVLAGIALVTSAYIVLRHLRQPASAKFQTAFRAAWLFLDLCAPIWFSVEYFYLFKQCGQPGTFEAFKYGQELAYRVWVGIATAMTLLYVKES